jgi:hypothetical protein
LLFVSLLYRHVFHSSRISFMYIQGYSKSMVQK